MTVLYAWENAMLKIDNIISVVWLIAFILIGMYLSRAQKELAMEDITASPGNCYHSSGVCNE